MHGADAPLFDKEYPGPADGRSVWLTTADNVRIRVAFWGRTAPHGTVFLFPGRTEYVEKYAPAAADLAKRGFATLTIDWRGQGLADRLIPDRRIGHIDDFEHYQRDVAAMVAFAEAEDLPRPWFVLGHSMGGCIALRSLLDGLPVAAAAFTGPMWGIRIKPHLKPLAAVLKHLMPALGLGHNTPPTTVPHPYVSHAPFEDNMLTTHRPMWDMMRFHFEAHPDLSLGGPSYIWLRAALEECNALARCPSPPVPAVTYLGVQERIVQVQRVLRRMENWQGAHLDLVEGSEHEVLMEGPDIRARVFDDMAARFLDAGNAGGHA